MAYHLLFKLLRETFSTQDLEDLCMELGYSTGEVFTQPGNLSRMTQDIQEFARRRSEEQQLLAAIHGMRPKVDLTPYGYEGGSVAAPPAPVGVPPVAPPPGPVAPANQKVYISYAWGGASEQLVNELDKAFQEKGLTLVRDKRDLGFKGSISEFMREIGRAGAIVIVINDKYLKSPNCMFELTEIAANKDFQDRVFPVVLSDADIYDPVNRIKYVQHWEQKLSALDEAMKSVSAANLQGFREEIDSYQTIRSTISELVFILKDMNTLTPDMHRDGDFAIIFDAIQRRFS
jgi:hypothetical protein